VLAGTGPQSGELMHGWINDVAAIANVADNRPDDLLALFFELTSRVGAQLPVRGRRGKGGAMDDTRQLLHGRRQGSGIALVTGLRVPLWWLGHVLVLASRFSALVRSQITRSLMVEISTDDGVAMHWVFDSQRQLVSVSTGPAEAPDVAVRFTSSGQALRDLMSPGALDRIMVGRIDGTVRIEGNPLILVWFHGLTAPGGR